MKTVDQILAEAAGKGLWLHNLFQLRTYPGHNCVPQLTGEWQANFSNAEGCYEFGRGRSAVEALENAMQEYEAEKKPTRRAIPQRLPPHEPPASLDALL